MFHRIIIIISLLTCNFSAQAIQVKQIYEAEVEVKDQETEQRAEAIQQAFEKVLIKVTGLHQSEIKNILNNEMNLADQYVQQFKYRLEEKLPEEEIPNENNKNKVIAVEIDNNKEQTAPLNDNAENSETTEPQLVTHYYLWVKFYEESVTRLLKKYSLPVWGKIRPLTLIWLAMDEFGKRSILGESQPSEIITIADDISKSRAIPIVFPLLDLTDRSLLFSDVWGNFSDNILRASTRYEPDTILVGRLNHYRKDYLGIKWTLYQGGDELSFSHEGATIEKVFMLSFNTLADKLAERYATNTTNSVIQQLTLHVSNVSSLSQYVKLMDYLKQIDLISNSYPTQFGQNNIKLELFIQGEINTLKQSISLSDVLSNTEEDTVTNITTDNTLPPQNIPNLYYQLN